MPSTQILARESVEQGHACNGDVIITAEQIAGYGRRGRSWTHQAGNVYLTLTRFFAVNQQHLLAHYGFVASLAIAAACQHFVTGTLATVTLKWPNDVLVNNAKIAGILLEKLEQPAGCVLLLGVGVNLVTPQDVDQKVAALDQFLPNSMAPKDFILVFLEHFTKFEIALRQGGFAAIRQQWLAAAKGQGQPITARLANGTNLDGVFLDLDHQGALLLQTDDMIKTITAADIFFTD